MVQQVSLLPPADREWECGDTEGQRWRADADWMAHGPSMTEEFSRNGTREERNKMIHKESSPTPSHFVCGNNHLEPHVSSKGASIYDVRIILGILDPPLPLHPHFIDCLSAKSADFWTPSPPVRTYLMEAPLQKMHLLICSSAIPRFRLSKSFQS